MPQQATIHTHTHTDHDFGTYGVVEVYATSAYPV